MSLVCITVDHGRNALPSETPQRCSRVSQGSPVADVLVIVALIRSLEKPIRILFRARVTRLSKFGEHMGNTQVLCAQNGKTPLPVEVRE